MAKIIVVRHGETALNKARVFQPESTPLNERGVQQARLVAERLKSYRIVKVLTSDFSRTLETTLHIVAALPYPVPVEVTPLLRERSFGDFRGQSIESVNKDPSVDLFRGDYEPPNGESWNTFHHRAKQAWDWVLGRAHESVQTAEDVVVVVTHGLVLTSFARKIWNAIPKQAFHNTSVSTVTLKAPHNVEVLNCAEHLPHELQDHDPIFSEQRPSVGGNTAGGGAASTAASSKL
jgi:probable phosphoglycerate mutase